MAACHHPIGHDSFFGGVRPLAVTLDTVGDAVMIWKTTAGFNGAALSSAASAWSIKTSAFSTIYDQDPFLLGIDASGEALAVYYKQQLGLRTLMSSRLPYGGAAWGPILSVSGPNTNNVPLSLAEDASGHAVTIMLRSGGFDPIVGASLAAPPNTTWVVTTPDVTLSSQDFFDFKVSMDGSGNAYSACNVFIPSSKLINSVLPVATPTVWEGPTDISQPSINSQPLFLTRAGNIAAGATSGTALATWLSFNQTTQEKYVMASRGHYLTTPVITGVSPNSGSVVGGNSVTITGHDLSTASAVKFGTLDAASYTLVSDNEIDAIAPENFNPGVVNIRVTTSIATTAITPADEYTYVGVPVVYSISPASGPIFGGTAVSINGVLFTGATGVSFGGTPAASFTVNSDDTITAMSPAHLTGLVDIVVSNTNGSSPIVAGDKFYFGTPTVTSISPTGGPDFGGNTVDIIGTGFNSATQVYFGTDVADGYSLNSDTEIFAYPAAHAAGTVDVRVENDAGKSPTSPADLYTFNTTPKVTAISPNKGNTGGGTLVTVTGTGFASVFDVRFDGNSVPFTIVNDTKLTATAPFHAAGMINIVVENYNGSSQLTLANQYTYLPPVVTSISPAGGPASASTLVTVTGTGFLGALGVNFDVTSGTALQILSDTQLKILSPALADGTVDVTVINAGATSATSNASKFTFGVPVISGASPQSGPTTGNTTVTITGSGFTGVTGVKFGTSNAASFTVNSSTTITAKTPAHAAGTVNITVSNAAGTSTTFAQFVFGTAKVTAVTPGSGAQTGPYDIAITGQSFTGVTYAYFGGLNNFFLPFTINSDTSLTIHVPVGIFLSEYHIQLQNNAGPINSQSSLSPATDADVFVFDVPGVFPGLTTPGAGPTGGGTLASYGGNLANLTSVLFDGSPIAYTSTTNVPPNGGPSTTTVKMTTPPHAAGSVVVTFTNAQGSSPGISTAFFTYGAPVISSLSAGFGPLSGGNPVTITGTGLGNATAVSFGGTLATSFTINSGTSITAIAPPHVVGTVDIRVTNAAGTSAVVPADKYIYTGVPVITNVSPNSGTTGGGTVVTLTGTGFLSATSATFGGTPGTGIQIINDTQMKVTSPAKTAGTFHIIVTNAAGASTPVAADQFTFLPPAVTKVSSNAGPTGGGTVVTITGTDFFRITGPTGVLFGATPATSYTVNSSTSIIATSPFSAISTAVDVRVQNSGAISAITVADEFTYGFPVLSAISPGAGSTGGSTVVTLTGKNFSLATDVTFDGIPALSFTVNSDTKITATTPAHAAGTIEVVVTNLNGSSTSSAGSKYTYGVPVVTLLTPNLGINTGGTSVAISGSGFYYATAVSFGSTPAASFTINSDSSITATAPLHTAGIVDVRVTNAAGTSAIVLADQYTYLIIPKITAVTPNTGPAVGGTTVTITGLGLASTTAVFFGGTPGVINTHTGDTQITATSPAHVVGAIDITVSNAVGTSPTSAADIFTYYGSPTITSVTPNAGPTFGGTSVTIKGTNLLSVTIVNFGGFAATSFTANSDTTITAIAPGQGAGLVDIQVINPNGASSLTPADQFTYFSPPTVTNVVPRGGSQFGGTSVAITGTNFTYATAVKFGTTNATSFTINSNSSITAISPPNSPATVDVTVVNAAGTSPTFTADLYTFGTPAVTNVTPNFDVYTGGAPITISGARFSNATAVSFGGTPAAAFNVVNDSTISATAPAHAVGVYDVTVANNTGTSPVSNADKFTFKGPSEITSVTPNKGGTAGGTSVTIIGANFDVVTSVSFNATPVTSFTINSATKITAIMPPGSVGTGHVRLQNSYGYVSTDTVADEYTYVDVATVTNVSPNIGFPAGGTSVTVTGTSFTYATAVTFGGKPGTNLVVINDNQLTITSPSNPFGIVDIKVVNPAGTSAAVPADQFSYALQPVITSVSPIAGTINGGTLVTVNGNSFSGATGVNFGSTPGTGLTVVNDNQITITSPVHVAGAVDIFVINPGGSSLPSAGSQYIYDDVPTVTSVSPSAGSTGGGNTVTVTGTGLASAAGVDFGGGAGTNIVRISDTQLTVKAPAHSAGTVHVTVTNTTGTSSATNADRYTYGAPVVTLVSPTAGTTSGGTAVTITGTGFANATSVKFGTTAASFTVNSDLSITVTSPAEGALPNTVDIIVANAAGSSAVTPADKFTYGVPVVSSVSPDAGTIAGGTSVTIKGSRFTNATGVFFGGTPGTIVTNTGNIITALSPASAAGTIDITVVNAVGTSATSAADTFTFGPPSIYFLFPGAGSPYGNTSVSIIGSGLGNASSVSFGGANGTIVSRSNSSIEVKSPAHGAGLVDITVTNAAGTSTITSGDQYVFGTPVISLVSPNAGDTAGGNVITITGSRLTNTIDITFGGISSSFTVDSDTQITATAPGHLPGTVDIIATNDFGTSAITAADKYTYGTPVIASLSPAAGTTAGGTYVTITGSGFTNATAVIFDSIPATIVSKTETSIFAIAPAHIAGTIDVRVQNAAGFSDLTNTDKYTYGPPVVTLVSPSNGGNTGGTIVAVTGSGFTNATKVYFGNALAHNLSIISDTSLSVISPSYALGTVDITVLNAAGASATSPADQFTYYPKPVINGINPNVGVTLGGTVVTITGSGFTSAYDLLFDTTMVAFTINSDTSITATAPAHAAGMINVVVVTLGGESPIGPGNEFTYTPLPEITNVSPNAVASPGVTGVNITGSNFTGATSVKFGTVEAITFHVINDSVINALSPSQFPATVDIRVQTPVGTSPITSADKFTYGQPLVFGASPSSGPAAGGTPVTLTGSGFANATAVNFGATTVVSFTINSDSSITVTSPAHAAGIVNITVANAAGTSPNFATYQYNP